MKILSALVITASPFLVVTSVSARDMTAWVKTSCNQGRCTSVRIVSSSVYFKHRTPDGEVWTVQADCKRGRTRAVFSNGTKARWLKVPANSVGERMLLQVCR